MSRSRRQRAGAIVAVFALGSALTACADTPDDGTVELSFQWWGNDERAQATQAAIDLFMAENPDIRVEVSYADYNAYVERLSTQVAGGNSPDVIQTDTPFLREFADRGVLRDLGEYVGEGIDTGSLPTELIDAGSINGILYGLPAGQNTQAILLDNAIWEEAGVTPPEAGWTWAQFEAAGAELHEATDGEVYGYTDVGGFSDWFDFWLRQDGKALYNPDGTLGFEEADLVAFWTWTKGLQDNGTFTPAEVTTTFTGGTDTSPLLAGRAGGEFNYDSTAPGYHAAFDGEITLSPWPTDTGSSGMTAGAASMYSIGTASEHPEEAAQLIDFMVNNVEAGQELGVVRSMPPNSAVREAIASELDGPNQQVFEYQESVAGMLSGAPPAPPAGAGSVKRSFTVVYDSFNFGGMSVEEAAAQLIGEAEQSIG
ncbi:ABC transporter substrate-binding protein [Actinoalloteichus hymeniacidonis]|uniref:ABC-type sugar transport system, periplasmic component n=1 Tax=Actinoalloteichus hymeniacidonis TaxID=340345 RepID=A0AAC9HSN2_9PSEU|nr:ABC transporter substrate-binding protein [Actinoalloteichus hymeniacidonis]AOS64932.1 ABC-type sugar transport system, periplasmic component [Actinoalloteichus hymeniacidonis]MBB5906993.1 multiple sugar transport system substrate-binding protein [Actinoalloteichus hymeniacidonis]